MKKENKKISLTKRQMLAIFIAVIMLLSVIPVFLISF